MGRRARRQPAQCLGSAARCSPGWLFGSALGAALDTPPPPASQGNDSPHRKKRVGGGVGRKKHKGLASGYILFFLRLPRDFARLD